MPEDVKKKSLKERIKSALVAAVNSASKAAAEALFNRR